MRNRNHDSPTATWMALGLLVLGLAAGACSDDSSSPSDTGGDGGGDMAGDMAGDMTPDTTPDTTPDVEEDVTADIGTDVPVETGEVRVLHLSRDAGDVDVFVNSGDTPAVPDLAFLAGTDYVELPAATYDFQVSAAGDSAEDAVLEINDVVLPADASATAVAIGDAVPSDGSAALDSLVIVDDYSDSGAGNIRFRAIHAASTVGQVDIWNLTDPTNPSPLYPDLDFGVVGAYLTVPEGAYTVGIDTTDDGVAELIFNLPELAAGTVANVYAVTDADGTVFLYAQLAGDVLARIDAVGPASLRVMHLSDDAGNVDIYVDGALAIPDLAFEDGSVYTELAQGAYDIDVTAAGGSIDDAVISLDAVPLDGEVKYTAVAFGPAADLATSGFELLEDDDVAITANTIRIRAFHAANGVGEVDIWSMPTSADDVALPLIPDLAYGAQAAALDVPPGFYILGLDTDNDGVPELEFNVDTSAVPPLTFLNVFAATDGADPFAAAQLPDGTVLIIEPAGTAEVRVVHLSPDAPNVDVYVGEISGDPAIVDLPFPEASAAFADLAAQGLFTFKVTETGMTTEVLSIDDLLLLGDESYTAVAYDDVATLTALALQEDYSDVESGKIRVRAVHAANAAAFADVDVWVKVGEGAFTLVEDEFLFGDVGEYAEIDAGVVVVGLDTGDDGTPDATFTLGDVAAGTVANIFAVNDDADVPFLVVLGPSGAGTEVPADD